MTRGKVAIFAGSVGSAGAARLAARAVQAAGAGYCTLYTDEDAYEVIAPGLDSIIVKPLSSSSFPAISADVILVGPGWGISDSKRILLEKILSTEIPVLIDAGALRILARHPEVLTRRKAACALTPHPGEFSDLAASFGQGGDETTIVALRRLAAAWSCNILFKSHVSLSVTPEGEIDLWDGMTPELGTAGSGDILSGLAAGLAARELCRNRPPGSDHGARIADSLRKALTLAMATHGFAGKNLAESSGWFTAEDILPECARILHDTRIQPQAARLSP